MEGTATTRTLVGTAVPTLMLKLTLEARGPLETTVLRIVVRCSVVSVLEPIRKVWIYSEAFAASRLSMMRIMARRMNAATVVA